MRCIKAGRPQANGQAESWVKLLKDKLKLLALENGNCLFFARDWNPKRNVLFWGENQFPRQWDGVMFYNALQIIRCDPCQATGFAPAERMIGRQLVYPVEFSRADIDFSGTTMTTPLVLKLQQIREDTFGKATKKIKKNQTRYKKQYDRRMNAKPFAIKPGDKVQYKRHKSKRTLSKTDENTLWCPVYGYHLVLFVDTKKQTVFLQDAQGKKLTKTHPFARLRKYKGKI